MMNIDRHNLPSYRERLKMFRLKTLQHRRFAADLVFGFRVLRGELKLKASKYWVFRPTSARSGAFTVHYPKIYRKSHSVVYNFVFDRCARWLQMLPSETLQSGNSKVFKNRLRKLDLPQLLSFGNELD